MDINSLDARGTVCLAELPCDTASTRLQFSVGVDALILSAYMRLLMKGSAYLVGSRLTVDIASGHASRAELLGRD